MTYSYQELKISLPPINGPLLKHDNPPDVSNQGKDMV